MKSEELRHKYLEFFEKKGHKVIPSASLVPEGDSTTLFTGSGMQSMISYLLGAEHPLGTRITDSQKSFRAEDITEVGDNRHTTFFEMLGNWSLGDYWKKDQLSWLFEFLTKQVGLDPNKLYVSVFAGDPKNNLQKDDESPKIWQELFESAGVNPAGRILPYDSNKNWWSRAGIPENMPIGEPGGPDSEIFFDFGTKHDPKFGKECHPNCDCGRFMEIGNSVFMEYVKTEKGFEKLKQRNVDFGGGLERITAASNNDPDIFNVDSLSLIVTKVKTLAVKDDNKARRVIADHLRAAVFLLADGVIPSNKDRGYILRRLIRRAVTYGKKLGIENEFSTEIAAVVIHKYGDVYKELVRHENNILDELNKEEMKFRATLSKGLKLLEGKDKLTGREAFDLFQSYGFPFELIEEFGKFSDRKEFEQEFAKHQELSRTASAGQFKGGLADHTDKIIRLHTVSHLMNAALRKVLGEHVSQKGSNITEERTRFDFTHDKKMTNEEKKQVETLVNDWITRDLPVKKEILPLEDAKKLGAIGVFGEKYPDTVSVYSIIDPQTNEVVSREFCGGPHVEHTGIIGNFKIIKEEASSAGIRRIKAGVE